MKTRSSLPLAWLVAGCVAVLAACEQSPAPEADARGDAAPATCERLAQIALPETTVTAAELVPAGGFVSPASAADALGPPPDYSQLPAFCRFAATVSPVPDSQIDFEVWLPAEGWNGKFVGVGNGGLAGAIFHFAMVEPLVRGYAVAGTNTGHDGGAADTSFAVGHPEKVADFGWRAVHEMTVKSKAVVAEHYGEPASRSYWVGCSTGGRQGLKEAQRYPEDYDGISAGAPASNWVPLLAYSTEVQRIVTDPEVGLSQPQLDLVKRTAIETCDARDGVTDRVVEDPRSCDFDPAVLQCEAEAKPGCLAPAQVDAVRSIYAGVVDPSTGETLLPGPTPGGELAWLAYQPGQFPIGANYWRDLIVGDPGWDLGTFDVGADAAEALGADSGDVTATDPDLRDFVARGGKLLLWHGWTDGLIPPRNTIDYYEDVLAATGGETVRDSVRLFMLPGVDHCTGGEGAFVMDALGVIDAWVESSTAPGRIVASRPLREGGERTRPLCPYPQVARYRGQGSTDDAASFECAESAAP